MRREPQELLAADFLGAPLLQRYLMRGLLLLLLGFLLLLLLGAPLLLPPNPVCSGALLLQREARGGPSEGPLPAAAFSAVWEGPPLLLL